MKADMHKKYKRKILAKDLMLRAMTIVHV